MPRLIDADAFNVIGLDAKSEEFIKGAEYILGMIDEQQTAYDVEKVVEQIHEYFNGKIDACEEDIVPQEILEYNKAICEIVRKGGVK